RSLRRTDVESPALRRRRRPGARLSGRRFNQDDGRRRGVLRIEQMWRDRDPWRPTMIDTHQHYWRYDSAAYGWIDDSMAALKRDVPPPEALPEVVRTGVTGSIAAQARHA